MLRRLTVAVRTGSFRPPMTQPACFRCRQTFGPEFPAAAKGGPGPLPAWRDDRGQRLCVPCAMGLALPDRPAGPDVLAAPRYALPPAVADAVAAEIDLGTGRAWSVGILEFSMGGMRLDAPVTFGVATPAVVVLRDRAGEIDPAVFAVEVRWVRPAPAGRWILGTRVIAAVDGHHAAFLSKVLERVGVGAGAVSRRRES